MNLAAYTKEANECEGISTQEKQGFAALNMGRKKRKYHVCQFSFHVQFQLASLFTQLIAGECYKNEERGKSTGEGKIIIEKGNKRENWKFNEVTVWDRIQLIFWPIVLLGSQVKTQPLARRKCPIRLKSPIPFTKTFRCNFRQEHGL